MTTKSLWAADIIVASLRGGETMTIFRAFIAILLFGFALAGCGQSGPLYLPGNPTEVQSVSGGQAGTPAPQANSSDEDDDEDGG